jgi:transmembrane sensor
MTRPPEPTLDTPLDGDAAYWFARVGRTTAEGLPPAERAAFLAWLAEPANRESLANVERAWAVSGQLAASPEIAELRQAYRRRRPARPVSRTAGLRAPLGYAALAASGVLAAVLLAETPQLAPKLGAEVREIVAPGRLIETRPGQQLTVALNDGSTVTLDGRSAIRVRFSGARRQVKLESGRAYFDVAHDAARPFTVVAGDGETRDIGTRFVVESDAGKVRVSLIEGRVEVRSRASGASSQVVALTAGEEATYRARTPVRRRLAHVRDPLDWTRGRLTFADTSLGDAAAELSRYTAEPIEVAAGVQDRPVSGVFYVANRAEFAESLAAALGLEAVRRADGSVLLTD